MRASERAAGQICAQDAEDGADALTRVSADEPDEAGSEHGGGSGEHLGAQRVDGGEVGGEASSEVWRDRLCARLRL